MANLLTGGWIIGSNDVAVMAASQSARTNLALC